MWNPLVGEALRECVGSFDMAGSRVRSWNGSERDEDDVEVEPGMRGEVEGDKGGVRGSA